MWLSVIIADRVAFVPAWTFCVALGVLVAWLRWRSPWRKR